MFVYSKAELNQGRSRYGQAVLAVRLYSHAERI